jgi:MarR-like DNA-binding transcriptional regulator SgrR of sgrS sRNA
MDSAGMIARGFRTSQCGQTIHPSSIGSKLSVFEEFALHELWFEPVYEIRELQAPKRLCLRLALEHPYASLDLPLA